MGGHHFNRGNTIQQLVQQSTIVYNNGHLAIKITPQNRRLARDFNAPPYQGRIAPSEVPSVYHCISEHYTLNAYENPGYQPNTPRG
jgi:hypothetical protein